MIFSRNLAVLIGLVTVATLMSLGTIQTPTAYAEVTKTNPHLFVSAEGQDSENQIAQGNIIEVIINDNTIGDTDEAEAEPSVTINGADLRMLQTANGDWRAYFAQVDALTAIDAMNGQLDYGVSCTAQQASTLTGIPLSETKGVFFPPGSNCDSSSSTANGHPLIRETRDLTNHDGSSLGQLGLANANLWPFIQVYDFAPESEVTITYARGDDTSETVVLEFDDPSESHSLNNEKYPQGAHVLVTIEDYALNIDPTDEDMWAFDTANKKAYYNLFDEDGKSLNINDAEIVDYAQYSTGIGEQIQIVRNAQSGEPLIDCKVTIDFGIQDVNNVNLDYLVTGDNGACVVNDAYAANPASAAADAIFTEANFVIGFVEDGSNNNQFINWAEDQSSNIVVRDDADRNRSFEVDYNDPSAISGLVGHFYAEMSIDVPDDTWNSGERIDFVLTDADVNTNPLAENDLTVANPASLLVPSIRIGSPITLASATGNVVWFDLADGGGASPKLAYTWTGADKEVEPFSDRLRLSDLSEEMDIVGKSKIVIYGWEPPTFADGIITLFNWDFAGISNADVLDIRLANADHSASVSLGTTFVGLADITHMQSEIKALGDTVDLVIMLENTNIEYISDDIMMVADFFTFGQTPDDNRVNNAIYRIEVEEVTPDNSDFRGTIEYTMLNQLNYDDPATYTSLRAIDEDVSIIVHEDFTDEDSVRVNYLDLGADGVSTQIVIQQEAPTHSGVVSFDSDNYKIADTVTITVEDADLNVNNDVTDIYTFSTASLHKDKIGSASERADAFILDVTFDDELWTSGACGETSIGFEATGFTLAETSRNSGVFTGDFQIPEVYCQASTIVSVTGTDIGVNYQDFRDASGEELEVAADAAIRANTGTAIRANTGTVSLDRIVYPVPFGPNVFEDAAGNHLAQGDLSAYIRVNDADFDISAASEDTIPANLLAVNVIRGSAIQNIPLDTDTITEIAPDAGVFELDLIISHTNGPTQGCPQEFANGGCILQGDILQVEYTDPTDASGESNTVTDSATFDLRNGVLQSDKSVYIIGSDMILTLIEPDLDLDSDGAETYTLDLIEWDSDADTVAMGSDPAFDPEPNGLRETGDSTGIFQSIIEIPAELDGDRLERGEEIELEYVDYGPFGSDFIGDETKDINLTIFTSFGATIELDQKVYTWTDKVYITIVAPEHNFDDGLVDEIGNSDDDSIKISTRISDIDNYKLVETGPDTGIFTGEIILVGFDHNADGDTQTGENGYDNPQQPTSQDGSGPTDGYIEAYDDDGITVSFELSEDETVVGSALIRWNIGEVQWLEDSYPASGTGVVRVIDPDMNLNPEAVDNFEVDVWSDRDSGGISLTVTETNQATGIFEGTVFFTTTDVSTGHRLQVAEGDMVTAVYDDNTLPNPYTVQDKLGIEADITITVTQQQEPADDTSPGNIQNTVKMCR